MPVTFAQAKVGMQEKIYLPIIEQFQTSSVLIDALPFDNAVSAPTGGSVLAYTYVFEKTPSSAQGRQINAEYTPSEAEKDTNTIILTINGGSFKIDRVIAKTGGQGFANEVAFQMAQKIKAVTARFNYMLLHGDYEGTKSTASPEFDGVDKLLERASADTIIDGSTLDVSGAIDKAKANEVVDNMDKLIGAMDRKPQMIISNKAFLQKLKASARELGYWEHSRDEFGRSVDAYDGIRLVDLGKYYNGATNEDLVKVVANKTNVYALSFGMDALHGVTPTASVGGLGIEAILPDYSTSGSVKEGSVEMVAGVVIKNTRSCAILKNVVVSA